MKLTVDWTKIALAVIGILFIGTAIKGCNDQMDFNRRYLAIQEQAKQAEDSVQTLEVIKDSLEAINEAQEVVIHNRDTDIANRDASLRRLRAQNAALKDSVGNLPSICDPCKKYAAGLENEIDSLRVQEDTLKIQVADLKVSKENVEARLRLTELQRDEYKKTNDSVKALPPPNRLLGLNVTPTQAFLAGSAVTIGVKLLAEILKGGN